VSGNVFVLSADSLRLDRTLDDDVMPSLVDLGERATRFTNAVSNGPFTPASFPTLLASRYASSIDGVGIPPEGGVTTIAEQLREAGYRTALWSDNKFVGGEYNYDRGYEEGAGYEQSLRDTVREYIDEDGLLFRTLEFGYMRVWKRMKNTAGDSHYYATAGRLNGKARRWLDDLDPDRDDVHVWLHYMDTHHPYEPPEEHMPYEDLEVVTDRTEANNLTRRVVSSDGRDATQAEIADVRTLYDAECRYFDEQVRRFVGWLREEGWLGAEDVLVVTSDHGEILYQYDTWGVFGHENVFTEECTRIPLIVEGGEKGGETLPATDVAGQASLVDLMPTLLDLLDLSIPDSAMGESLVPVVTGRRRADEFVFYDGTMGYNGVRTDDGRKAFNCEDRGNDEYVRTTFDPALADREYGEAEPRDGQLEDSLVTEVQRLEREAKRRASDAEAIDPDSIQVEQHMKDLGYLE
jgi:arylsulfatase A-like enzyme